MTWPSSALSAKVDLYLGGAWQDITTYIFTRDGIQISRGRADEASEVDRSTCKLTLDNRDGRFSPRNPRGAYFASTPLGRNTPIRVSHFGLLTCALRLDTPGQYSSTPDAAALRITGDLDLRIDIAADNMVDSTDLDVDTIYLSGQWLLGKWDALGNQRAYGMYLSGSAFTQLGYPVYVSSSAGSATTIRATATAPLPVIPGKRISVRATHSVNNGASGNTVTFYYGTGGVGGSFTQLGDPVVTAGTTSIFAGTAPLTIGYEGSGFFRGLVGRVYKVQVRSGIAGSVLTNPDFTAQTDLTTSFTDSNSHTWTLSSGAEISSRSVRFRGEVSSWPAAWDPSGHDIYVQIEASGILRRLSQGTTAAFSPIRRSILQRAVTPLAYWPCEDPAGGSGSSAFGSAIAGVTPITSYGSPTYAGSTVFTGSSALPFVNSTKWTGTVPAYTAPSPNALQVWFLAYIPSGSSPANGSVIARLQLSGSVRTVDLIYNTGGGLTLTLYDSSLTSLATTGVVAFACQDKLIRLSIELTQSGTTVNYVVNQAQAATYPVLSTSGSLATNTFGTCRSVQISPKGELGATIVIGHVSVHQDVISLYSYGYSTTVSALSGWAGEPAGIRIARVCNEEGIILHSTGDANNTALCGSQPVASILDILHDAEAVDMGILHEPREYYGLAYRPRESLMNNTTQLALNYTSSKHLSTMTPVDDDQLIRNSATITRTGGTTQSYALTSGSLSIQSPPNGIGKYDTQATVNLYADSQLADQASWRVHAGTVDISRYPTLGVDLARSELASLRESALFTDIGDYISVTSLPTWVAPESVVQVVQGHTESFVQIGSYALNFSVTPSQPYNVGIYAAAVLSTANKYAPSPSTLTSTINTVVTSVSVTIDTTNGGVLWTTDVNEMPFDIMVGGERMTVTAISGASSPQTFTVTRGVNGFSGAHQNGIAVTLFTPVYYDL